MVLTVFAGMAEFERALSAASLLYSAWGFYGDRRHRQHDKPH